MTRQSYYYSRASLSGIADGLNRIFASLRRETGDVYVRSTSSNVIIPVSSEKDLNELDAFIDKFTLLQPSRFFILIYTAQPGQLGADITARCHGLTATQHVCCEVVRISCPDGSLSALPELVRANLIPGMATRLLAMDSRVESAALDSLAPMCDEIIFDSSDFEDRSDFLTHLLDLSPRLIDLQWVALGLWREQLRLVFERPICQQVLPLLETIILTATPSSPETGHKLRAASIVLLAGWFIDSLGLEVFRSSPGGFDCYSQQGKLVRLVFEEKGIAERSRMDQAHMLFRHSPSELFSVSLRRGERLEVAVKMKENLVYSCYFEDETPWGLLKRYFQLGEVFGQYSTALRNAVDLRSLRGVGEAETPGGIG